MLPHGGGFPEGGLRARKKARTREAIQVHAMQLFREQGYAATTVEQIAAAADVSPSTFFRYFGSKGDVVVGDWFDPALLAAFSAQPAELAPLQALRRAVHTVLGALPHGDRELQRERSELAGAVPELRARLLDHLIGRIEPFSDAVARRTGRYADDFEVRNLVGAVVGVTLAAVPAGSGSAPTDLFERVDEAIAHLEAGLPL